MKKLLALSAIALGLSTSAFANTSQTITISGEVIAQTCKLDVSLENRIVRLDKVKLEDLKNNVNVPKKDIALKVVDCDTKNTQTVVVAFDGASANIDRDNGNLNNTLTGTNTSSGVQIKLLNTDDAHINLSQSNNLELLRSAQRTLNDSNNTIKFKATYAVKGNAPTTGTVTSSIPVVLTYQ